MSGRVTAKHSRRQRAPTFEPRTWWEAAHANRQAVHTEEQQSDWLSDAEPTGTGDEAPPALEHRYNSFVLRPTMSLHGFDHARELHQKRVEEHFKRVEEALRQTALSRDKKLAMLSAARKPTARERVEARASQVAKVLEKSAATKIEAAARRRIIHREYTKSGHGALAYQ